VRIIHKILKIPISISSKYFIFKNIKPITILPRLYSRTAKKPLFDIEESGWKSMVQRKRKIRKEGE